MTTAKTPDATSPSGRKPYQPPTLISYGHVKDIVQTGGGGMGDGTNTSKSMCWVAEAIYGVDDARTLVLRSWLTAVHAGRQRGWVFVELYRRFGERAAGLIRGGLVPRATLRPLFDFLAEKAFDHSARTIVNERHCRTL
jgi:hypothetical protein